MKNPVVAVNAPDPCVTRMPDGSYVMVCTTNYNEEPDKFPLRRSTDLLHWSEPFGHVFPRGLTPRWAVEDFWAPEIHVLAGGLICYFTARHTSGKRAVGVATATSIDGPWQDLGAPLVLDEAAGWIDAHLFEDPTDGALWLYYKGDFNGLKPKRPTPIVARRLAPDGLAFAGDPVTVLVNDLPWEGTVVEGPWVVLREGRYYLFYAAHAYDRADYCTGVARSDAPTGPFEKLGRPMTSHDGWSGPGHGCLVVGPDGTDWFVYHAWEGEKVVKHGSAESWPRMALAAHVRWAAGWPIFDTWA